MLMHKESVQDSFLDSITLDNHEETDKSRGGAYYTLVLFLSVQATVNKEGLRSCHRPERTRGYGA